MKKQEYVLAAAVWLAVAAFCAAPAVAVDFGDDDREWANDGECDDPRFEGPGMTSTLLVEQDLRHDATDCRRAYERGDIWLRGSKPSRSEPSAGTARFDGGINFGNDRGEYANDGECDDMRFTGSGMTDTDLLDDDILHDASDCCAAYQAGRLHLRGVSDDGAIDFGDDRGSYTHDDECDDPRFEGAGMTTTALLSEDVMHDATDCSAAYRKGELRLR